MSISLNMVQTISFAVVLLLFGEFVVKRSKTLTKYCIPAPVVGGLTFAIIALILRSNDILTFELDNTLESVCMTMFFTSVGFNASLKLLKKGGLKVAIFLVVCLGLITLQNLVAVETAKFLGLSKLMGMTTGSIPMSGGHGTAAAMGKSLEASGVANANTITIAAATFGLVAGSMIGGPTGRRLIEKHGLKSSASAEFDSNNEVAEKQATLVADNFYSATFMILIAMGIGTIVSAWLESATGLTFPSYIGGMLVAALIRNTSDFTGKFEVHSTEIDIVGGIALSLFLSMALMGLRLWELASLAKEMVIMLVAQVILMFLYANFITFNIMGRDYEAAVLAAGHCGFGLGATPNGIANMNTVASKYGPAPTAFFVVPLVGGLFMDFFNIGIITFFINALM